VRPVSLFPFPCFERFHARERSSRRFKGPSGPGAHSGTNCRADEGVAVVAGAKAAGTPHLGLHGGHSHGGA
jgi:hypothetical protein